MSAQIGTNFNYRGQKFLDSRQGKAETKNDLLSWDFQKVPVPPGFELCLTLENNEVWYYYDPDLVLPDTGHWIPRLVDRDEWNSVGPTEMPESFGSRTVAADIILEMLREHEEALFPTSIKNVKAGGNNSGSSFEVGTTVTVSPITFNLVKGTNTIQTYTFPISPTTEKKNEYGTWEYSIPIQYNGKTYTATASIYWKYKLYWGVISELPEENDQLQASDFGTGILVTSGSLNTTSFNCSGGKYPCILIPWAYRKSNPRVIVGGLDNTDLVILPVNLVLRNGLVLKYQAICLGTKQTGDSIQIKVE